MFTNEEKQQDNIIRKVGAQLPGGQESVVSPRPAHPSAKYKPFPRVDLPDRTWPDKEIIRAPIWCSVDLRDGNQALAEPMSVSEKLEMFATLVQVGFKQIEIGFPSASQVEFDFCRRLIEENRIPRDVTVQILVQCREDLIRRSFEALQGAHSAIVHIYNSTNPAQRKIVFGLGKEEIKGIAVRATHLVKELAAAHPETEWTLQYSPESFVLTELDFSLEICEAVAAAWGPTPEKKIILNLPTTVESSTPNVHADQIEWFCRRISCRDAAIISLHTHNDRGTGVAATELALLAGADRVEGTLFGNGERTGNLDVVTVALNMYSQGVDPGLNFEDLDGIREVYERTTRMEVAPRHPYGGDLVFTAFSGSHQDAINKGFKAQDPHGYWEVPYLPIDPHDIGRSYEKIIRINSQSGKGGVAHVMEQDYGFDLPKKMRVEFGRIISAIADTQGGELGGAVMFAAFEAEYLKRTSPLDLVHFKSVEADEEGQPPVCCTATLTWNGEEKQVSGKGNGPIEAFIVALRNSGIAVCDVVSYAEHSLTAGAEAMAASYVELEMDGKTLYGVGVDNSIDRASLKAVVSGINRHFARQKG